MAKKKPKPLPEIADLNLYLDGKWRLSVSGYLKAYTRKDGSQYVNWNGRRVEVIGDSFTIEAFTGKDGLIYGVKKQPMTEREFERWTDPEFFDWCQENEPHEEEEEEAPILTPGTTHEHADLSLEETLALIAP